MRPSAQTSCMKIVRYIYYRRAVYVSFLTYVLGELKNFFGEDTVPIALQFNKLPRGLEIDVAAEFEVANIYEIAIK